MNNQPPNLEEQKICTDIECRKTGSDDLCFDCGAPMKAGHFVFVEDHPNLEDEEYIKELEKIIIFLCDVYTAGQDSLACQTNNKGEVDEKFMNVWVHFPTIQGTVNRINVRRIGNLRTTLGNRESIEISLEELFNKLVSGRKEIK